MTPPFSQTARIRNSSKGFTSRETVRGDLIAVDVLHRYLVRVRTVPPLVELDRSRSNVRFLVQLYVDDLMCLMAVHVECTSTVP
jgi:hypothetical protein